MADILVEHSNDLTTFKVTGTLTYDEILSAAQKHGSQITLNLIWDLTSSDDLQISSKQVQDFPHIVKEYMFNRKSGGKTALVGSKDHILGVLNMYSAFASIAELPYDVRAFKTLEEASEWVFSAPSH